MIRPTAQLSIQHALTLTKKHKYDKAIKILQKILNQASDPEKLLPLAGEFFAQKSPLYALKFAEKIRQKFPDHAPTIAFCGSMLFELREYLQAKAVMEYAFQLDSNHPTCQKIYVKYYSQLEKLNPQSIQNNIDKALKIDSSPDIYNLAGVSTEATGNIPQAIQYFKQGLRILIDSKVCPPPATVDKKIPIHLLKPAILQAHRIFTDLKIPFCLGHGTLLGIYRDGDMLSNDSDIDIMLPWKLDRHALVQSLKQQGCSVPSDHKIHTTGQWSMDIVLPIGITVELSFIKVEENHLLTGFIRGDKVIAIPFSKFELGELVYLGKIFHVPKDTPLYLKEFYGNDWNQRIRNRNFFIINDHVIDPHHIRISYTFNHILAGILNGELKQAHGYALQLLSIYEDPLLTEVCQFLEKHNPSIQWHTPLPPQSTRITRHTLEY